jgi:serine/threonine protein kinase
MAGPSAMAGSMDRLGGRRELGLVAERYELAGELGRGATGTVWEARDLRTNRAVAIKVLHAHLLTSALTRRRFLREVELASTLRHPHCVEVLAHGEDGRGAAYLVMERLYGSTLADRLRQAGPLPPQQAVKIVAQVLDAVGAAHRAQIVHRDLKPANVMLIEQDGDRDVVKVCDFGLAKAIVIEPQSRDDPSGELIDAGSLSTNYGDICGTPEYMAPEQARGELIDGRADLYSIGIILYQALVGRPPFQARSALAVVSMHLTAPPPRPSELRRDLGIYPPLEKLVLRALSKERAERPSSAEVFRADLLQIARDESRRHRPAARAPSDPAPATLSGGTARPPTRLTAFGVIGLALAGATFGAWRLHARTGRPTQPLAATASQTSAPLASASPLSAPSWSPAPASAAAKVIQAPAVRHAPRARPSREPPSREDSSEEMVGAAEARLGAGRTDEACALGQAAVEAYPRSPAPWQFLGRCRMRRGEAEAARAAFRRYLELAPGASDANFVHAIVDENP